MSLLSSRELHELIEQGVVDALHENVNGSSIDVRLGDQILIERPTEYEMRRLVDLAAKELPAMDELRLSELPNNRLVLQPGQFCLAHTLETFNLPEDVSAEFKLRSSVARAGLNHALAGWCDPGWHGSQLTLELKNWLKHHALLLSAGMRVGQVIFYRHVRVDPRDSYRAKGRYNGTVGVSRDSV